MHYLNSERERESIKVSDEINLQYFNANTLTLTLFFQSSSDSKIAYKKWTTTQHQKVKEEMSGFLHYWITLFSSSFSTFLLFCLQAV